MTTKNIFELDPERLATTDEHGNRVYLYPEDVKGKWKDRRKIVYWFLIFLYLVLPWIYINNKPALMIDIFNREFTLLGMTYHGVDPILLFLLVASTLFFIGFITSLYGRVWCGWACPQTVFIQSIFMKIETLVEGKARQRRERDKGPWTFERFARRSIKWILYSVISLHIANTFIGYFVGPRELFRMTMESPLENWGFFLASMIMTSIFLLDFGWFREQFCIIACPYGRMQSVIMDENSLVVAYDTKRGEPRKNGGDCINCYNCVKVCPTGIDIRRGTQLECIACTQCIDACDDIMTKIKKPTGLIRYSSENMMNNRPSKKLTVRSFIYIAISLLLVSSFFFFLNRSVQLNMVFLRSKIPYQVMAREGLVVNHFSVKLIHQGNSVYKVNFRIKDRPEIKVVTNLSPVLVDVPEKKVVMFLRFPPAILEGGSKKIQIEAYNVDTNEILNTKEVSLVGPVL